MHWFILCIFLVEFVWMKVPHYKKMNTDEVAKIIPGYLKGELIGLKSRGRLCFSSKLEILFMPLCLLSFRSQVLWLLNMSDGPPIFSLMLIIFKNVKEVHISFLPIQHYGCLSWLKCIVKSAWFWFVFTISQGFCLILNHQWVSNHWQTKLPKLWCSKIASQFCFLSSDSL